MKATLIFEKPELVLDIKQRAFAIARSHSEKGETPERDDNWLIDITNSEQLNREVGGRIINKAFLDAYAKLTPIAKEEESQDYLEGNRYVEVSTYTMFLNVADGVRSWQIRHLQDLVHEYIVYKALLLWCEMVSREHLEILAIRLGELDKEIKDAMKPLKGESGDRPLFPFG